MNELTVDGLVQQTKDLLGAVRGSLIKVAQNLYQIKESYTDDKAWGSFVEEELGISQSFASKLLTINRVYLLEGGLPSERIEGVDYEKLYAATKLDGSVEEKVAKASTLSRSELKQVKNQEKPHKGQFGSYCSVCWLSEENQG